MKPQKENKAVQKIALEKLDKIKKILPIVWDSYEHMRETRKQASDNFRNYLLIIISFLPLISLALFDHFDNALFFIPIIFQLIAFLLLIKTYFINDPQVPWINPDNILEQIDKNQFEVNFFIILKALENDTYTQLRETGKYITYSLYFLLFSLYTLILGVFFVYFKSITLYALILVLTGVLIYIYRFYIKPISYETNKNSEKYAKQIEEWINKT